MKINTNPIELERKISSYKNILFMQDIDGVCIPLVKDPMTRKLDSKYIYAANQLANEFFVLTCGEHEGLRGVNRIIERSIESNIIPREKGLYLPGLAACGVEYQNNYGEINYEGVSEDEIKFLSKVPDMIRPKFKEIVKQLFPNMDDNLISFHAKKSICDTRFSPTINFNSLFELVKDDWQKRNIIQEKFKRMMNEIIDNAASINLSDSFFLHISPNLGSKNGIEILKDSSKNDIGSTDIQLLLKGAKKDAGVICLLNKYIGTISGVKPFGENFNFRDAPKSLSDKINFCKKHIMPKNMPLIIGVGDTVTSHKTYKGQSILRGGSDRSFLEFIQYLGYEYGIKNNIIFVDSSAGEVFRPSTKNTNLDGITDDKDPLKFDIIFQNGTNEYINWFNKVANKRYKFKKNNNRIDESNFY